MLNADLASLALELAAWGVTDPLELRWLDPPPPAAFAQARELLHELDALDAAGRVSTHGREMAALALHPRLAHMLLKAQELGVEQAAADLAALLSERDILRAHDGFADPDLRQRLPLMRGDRASLPGHYVDAAALRRARTEAQHWRQRLLQRRRNRGHPERNPAAVDRRDGGDDDAGLLLAFAYPDRIGMQRGARGRFLLRNGRGAVIDPQHNLAGETTIVAADVGGHGRDSRIFLAAPVDLRLIEEHFASQIEDVTTVEWDAGTRSVRAHQTRRLGALVLGERPLRDVREEQIAEALFAGIRAEGLTLLDWSRDDQRLRERMAFLHTMDPEAWPAVSDAALLDSLEQWLLPWCSGIRSADALRRLPLAEALLSRMPWERRAQLDTLAPTHVEVPSGSRIVIDYSDPAAPTLAVRLQEMFGLADTPRVAGGRVPLTLKLLSPAQRPVQVTRDLASFWETTYFEVRRDLRGRYPKHYWPDDPLQAEPTRRTRPRS
jgi:ATP-dependent helicase HrpB